MIQALPESESAHGLSCKPLWFGGVSLETRHTSSGTVLSILEIVSGGPLTTGCRTVLCFMRRLKAARPNFEALWTMLLSAAVQGGNDRFTATIKNHSERKEYICRKLGVVCAVDVARIGQKLKKLNKT